MLHEYMIHMAILVKLVTFGLITIGICLVLYKLKWFY